MLSQENNIKIFVRSKPIDIIKKNNNTIDEINYDGKFMDTLETKNKNTNSDNTYKLDSICFDPTKFSPPDNWSTRLKNRIRNYEDVSSSYINYLFDNK